MDFNEANEKVHLVETQWHYKILTKYGWEAVTKEQTGFVRNYTYSHPLTSMTIVCTTGVNADYWTLLDGNKSIIGGYWCDLEPHLKTLTGVKE